MARLPRLAVGGAVHVVVQRGHNGQPVFADDADRQAYLAALREVLREHRVVLHGYALLDAEVWLVVQPPAAETLSRAMQALGRRFVAAVNRRHGRRGTLWDGRYRATVVDEGTQLLDVLVHVETKPVDAGLAAQPADWPWSSARHHLGLGRDPWLGEHAALWTLGNTPFERDSAWRRRRRRPRSPGAASFVLRLERRGRCTPPVLVRIELSPINDLTPPLPYKYAPTLIHRACAACCGAVTSHPFLFLDRRSRCACRTPGPGPR